MAGRIITPIIVRKIGKVKTKQGTGEGALLAGHLRVAVGKAASSTALDTGKNRTASANSVLRTFSSGQYTGEISIYGLLATTDESFPISTRRKSPVLHGYKIVNGIQYSEILRAAVPVYSQLVSYKEIVALKTTVMKTHSRKSLFARGT